FDRGKLGVENIVASDERGTDEQDEHVGAADRVLDFMAPVMAGLQAFVVPERKSIFPLDRLQLRQQPGASLEIVMRVGDESVHCSVRFAPLRLMPRRRGS